MVNRKDMDYNMTLKAVKNKDEVVSNNIQQIIDFINLQKDLNVEDVINQLDELKSFVEYYKIW